MAETFFSKSMKVEDLCIYLEQQGLEGEDLQKIRGKLELMQNQLAGCNNIPTDAGYNGRSILHLANKNYEGLYKLKMKEASVLVLQTLLEVSVTPDSLLKTHA